MKQEPVPVVPGRAWCGKLPDEIMGMIGDPFVKDYLQVMHTKKNSEDVQVEESDN